jgi:hypothetical protein
MVRAEEKVLMGRGKLTEQDHHLLVSDLQALVVESKRRYPDVKDVSIERITRQWYLLLILFSPASMLWSY